MYIVQLGYTQGRYERFTLQKLIRYTGRGGPLYLYLLYGYRTQGTGVVPLSPLGNCWPTQVRQRCTRLCTYMYHKSRQCGLGFMYDGKLVHIWKNTTAAGTLLKGQSHIITEASRYFTEYAFIMCLLLTPLYHYIFIFFWAWDWSITGKITTSVHRYIAQRRRT